MLQYHYLPTRCTPSNTAKRTGRPYLNHIPGGEITLMALEVLFGVLALAFLSGCYIRLAAQILATVLPLVILLIDGNLGYWHHNRKVEFWNQVKLIGHNVGVFAAALILATDGWTPPPTPPGSHRDLLRTEMLSRARDGIVDLHWSQSCRGSVTLRTPSWDDWM